MKADSHLDKRVVLMTLAVGLVAAVLFAAEWSAASVTQTIRPVEAAGAPSLDVRAGADIPPSAAARSARAALASSLGEGGIVSVEPETGALRIAGSTGRFLSAPAPGDPAAIALSYVRDNLDLFGLDATDLDGLRLSARYTSPDGVTHLTWQQVVAGIPSYDTVLFANVDADGRIVNVGGSPVSGLALDDPVADLGPAAALEAAAEDVGGSAGRQLAPAEGAERSTRFAGGDAASLVVLADPSGDRLGWRTIVDGEAGTYETVIDADSGEPLVRRSLTEDVANASVFDNYPGAPAGGTAHTVDLAADPAWLDNTSGNTRLWGNNSQAYSDLNDNNAADAAENVAASGGHWINPQTSFNVTPGNCGLVPSGCTWDPSVAASTATNRAQATTQAFYYVNNFHDWLLQAPVGFDEASHNFERVHTSAAPGAGDPVIAESNDGNAEATEHRNNANMSTPPDGSPPRMQMYFFYNASSPAWPAVNGDDDASIVYHEYTHGLSNRLVQNGVGGALDARQSKAMGEGWSDWYAMDYLASQGFETDTASPGEITVGEYATGDFVRGIRTQPLDCPVSFVTAPCTGSANAPQGGFTFADLGKVARFTTGVPSFEVHADGEIWAETLWDLRQALGATVSRGLIAAAMRLAPDDPGLLEMRDAILQADLVAGGASHDQIWSVFAVRGMGHGARSLSPSSTRGVASFSPPPLATSFSQAATDPAPLGDGDGAAEPGEAIRLTVQLSNSDTTALTNVRATLSSSTPGVVVGQSTAVYGTVGAGGTAASATPFAISVPAATACTTRVGLALQVSTDQGNVAVPLDDLTLGTGTQTFANTTPVAIPDGNRTTGASSAINVSGLPVGTKVSRLHVGIDVTHAWVGDVRAELTHGATTVSLIDQSGVVNASYGSEANNFAAVDLFDTAANSVQAAPFANVTPGRTGAQRPNEPLAAFDGADPNGTWTLKLNDLYTPDAGTLNSWSVTVPKPTCATSAAPLPEAVTGVASAVTSSAAHVAGQVDPKGAATEFAVQYGPTIAYGQGTAAAPAGSASGLAPVAADLAGLAASSDYHYRVVALRAGTVIALGADQVLHTASASIGGGQGAVSGGGGGSGAATTTPTAPKALKCRKGFRKKTVKGKARCVKKAKKKQKHKHR